MGQGQSNQNQLKGHMGKITGVRKAGGPMRWPRLWKRTTAGGSQLWDIEVQPVPDTDHGAIVVTYGLEAGKKQTKTELIKVGKNAGRSNATSPYQQAVNDAQSRWEMQLKRKGYGLTVKQSAKTRALSPMLAKDLRKVKVEIIDWDNAYVQPKLDGFRLLATKEAEGKIVIRSRENQLITTLDHLHEGLNAIMEVDDVFDGEAYCHEMTFQQMASAIKAKKESTEKIRFNLYDTVKNEPFADRLEYLMECMNSAPAPNVVFVATAKVADMGQARMAQQTFEEEGFEGAMLRHGDKPYESGKRSSSLLKLKSFMDAEFEVVRALEGRGDYVKMARFICLTDKGHEFEVMSPGTREDKRAYWRTRKKWLGKQLTVKFQEWTTSEKPVPRFPVALRFRDGSSPLKEKKCRKKKSPAASRAAAN